jgi:hypothetical protein
MEIITVEIDRISENYLYSYHFDKFSVELLKSIQSSGILMPLWLLQTEKYCLLDGYRRLMVAKELGLNAVPAILYSPETLEKAFLSNLYLNLSHSDLSVVEKLKIVKIVHQSGIKSLYNSTLKILELSYNLRISEIAVKVFNLPLVFQNFFHAKNISLKNLEKMLQFSFSDYKKWFKLCLDLPFNFNDFLHYLSKIKEIGRRDSQSSSEIWDNIEIDAIMTSKRTPQQKVQLIKNIIDMHRFPTLTLINQNLKDIAKILGREMAGGLTVTWDSSLENSDLSLVFNIKDKTDIHTIKSFFEKQKNRILIEDLLEKINQLP